MQTFLVVVILYLIMGLFSGYLIASFMWKSSRKENINKEFIVPILGTHIHYRAVSQPEDDDIRLIMLQIILTSFALWPFLPGASITIDKRNNSGN